MRHPRIIVVGGGLAGLMTVIRVAEGSRSISSRSSRSSARTRCARRAASTPRQHQGRGRQPPGPPRRDGLRRRLPRPTSRPSRAWPTRRPASSSCSTAWACPSTARPKACSTSAASAARSSTAPRSPAPPPASSSSTRSTSRCAAATSHDEHGIRPRREDGPQVRVLDFLQPSSTTTASASAASRRTSRRWRSAPSRATPWCCARAAAASSSAAPR